MDEQRSGVLALLGSTARHAALAMSIAAAIVFHGSAGAADYHADAGPTQCANVGGQVPGGYASVVICSAPGVTFQTRDPGHGDPWPDYYGCISIDTDEQEHLQGCGELEPGTLIVDPVLGTTTFSFVVPTDEAGVMLSASVTLVGDGPPDPSVSLGHTYGASLIDANVSAGAQRSAVSAPGSSVTSSHGWGGEMATGSSGFIASDVSATLMLWR